MTFPSWKYGPEGDARICADEADVPKGWADHPAGPFEGVKAAKPPPAPKPAASPPDADLVALRVEYKAALGKKPMGTWGADELRKRIAAHAAPAPTEDPAA